MKLTTPFYSLAPVCINKKYRSNLFRYPGCGFIRKGFSLDKVFWNITRSLRDFCSTFYVEVVSFMLLVFLLEIRSTYLTGLLPSVNTFCAVAAAVCSANWPREPFLQLGFKPQ